MEIHQIYDEETAQWHDKELARAADDKSNLVVFHLSEVIDLDLCSNCDANHQQKSWRENESDIKLFRSAAEIFNGHRRARTVDNAEPRNTTLHKHRVYKHGRVHGSGMLIHEFYNIGSKSGDYLNDLKW